jgi:hypothetical protein
VVGLVSTQIHGILVARHDKFLFHCLSNVRPKI